MRKTVLVCQYTTCGQQGAKKVFQTFQSYALSSDINVETTGCLGQCGSGPMVLILPDETWYCHIHPSDVPTIVEQHLKQGQVITKKLYPKFHHTRKSVWIWLVVFSLSLGAFVLFFAIVASQSYYF
ncbi:(2Fe-2S) ferredoxin domain-containing protein [Leptolyngbya cf. ectocarpi LEGE 11479]|uniref:(2Fe-2S) ferredoxin domain-containing protein n=1 Tax=Leptolyngbya cf. ectocarpi LEGE 11479 TaxID=1828722 RepID=A0A928X2G0_LEPEC|nr:(2Fe-2S) ferredoxin domain-containing protein [Leptolyngbya ectocarpi]MBE9066635.1 (2Fe-2S) ferredoxin domain-containing protein [Leptolyngbya cf. ectocarpi LEGE 11479]